MAIKGARQGARVVKKVVDKVKHSPFLKTYIPAAQAAPAPPLGPQLGQVKADISLRTTHGLVYKELDYGSTIFMYDVLLFVSLCTLRVCIKSVCILCSNN